MHASNQHTVPDEGEIFSLLPPLHFAKKYAVTQGIILVQILRKTATTCVLNRF